MVKAQLLITAAAVAAVGAFSPFNAPQTVRPTTRFRSSIDAMSGEEDDESVRRSWKIEWGSYPFSRRDETQRRAECELSQKDIFRPCDVMMSTYFFPAN